MTPNREPTSKNGTHPQRQANKDPRPYGWKKLYQLALIEVDGSQLPKRVSDARNAILDRIEETQAKPFPHEERQQLTDALKGLHVIQKEYERRIQRYGESRTARTMS
jgi:hypothetical protein